MLAKKFFVVQFNLRFEDSFYTRIHGFLKEGMHRTQKLYINVSVNGTFILSPSLPLLSPPMWCRV